MLSPDQITQLKAGMNLPTSTPSLTQPATHDWVDSLTGTSPNIAQSLSPGSQFGGSGSIGESIANTFKQGGQNVTQDVQNTQPNAQQAGNTPLAKSASVAQTAGHVAGDVAGTAGGLIGDVVSPLIPDAVNTKIGDVSKFITDKVNSIPGMTPDIAKSLSDVFNTLTLKGGAETAPVAENAVKSGTEAIGKGVDSAIQAMKDTTNKVSSAFEKTPEQLDKAHSNFVEKLITPDMSAKTTTSAIKTGKVAEGEGLLGKRDITNAIPGFDNIKASVEKVPGISDKNTALQNANLIHDAIGTTAEELKSQLKDKGSFTPAEFNKYMNGIKTTLSENPMIVGDAEKTAGKIVQKFNSLVKENGYTPAGLLEARKGLDKWMGAQKGNVFNPTTESAVSTALKAIRQGGNDFIASKVPDVAVKDMLAHQSNLYRAIDNIAPKAAKEAGSKLGRFTGFIKKHPISSAIIGDKILKHATGFGL